MNLENFLAVALIVAVAVAITSLYFKNQAAEEKIESQRDEILLLKDKLAELKSVNGRLALAYDGLLGDLNRTHASLTSTTERNTRLTTERKECDEKLRKKESTITGYKKELSALHNKKNKLTQQISRLEAENRALKNAANDNTSELIHGYELKLRRLEIEKNNMDQTIRKLKDSKIELLIESRDMHREQSKLYRERNIRLTEQLVSIGDDISDRLAYIDASVFYPPESKTPPRQTDVERLEKARSSAATYYNSSRCFVTGATAHDLPYEIRGDDFCPVIAAHLAPHANATSANSKGTAAGLSPFHVNGPSNFMFLRKDIEAAFDMFLLSFEYDHINEFWKLVIVHPNVDKLVSDALEQLLKSTVSASDLEKILEYLNQVGPISELEGCPLTFPEGRMPYTRVLRAHFHTSIDRMQNHNWRGYEDETFQRLVHRQEEMVKLVLSRRPTLSPSVDFSAD